MSSQQIEVVAGGAVGPLEITATARASEEWGFGHLWLVEDYFLTGGIAASALALANTKSISVGTGVVSALTRHPALLAMEFATLGHAFPGRVRMGVGLGLPLWMSQLGYSPESPVSALRSVVSATRRLLDGEIVTVNDDYTQLTEVRLEYPSPEIPIHVGAMGPRMLELSGQMAQGTILSLLASPAYIRSARTTIQPGPEHKITVFAIFNTNDDSEVARQSVRSRLAFSLKRGPSPLTDGAGLSEELKQFLEQKGASSLVEEMPDRWVKELTVTGNTQECIESIERLLEAGADTVALFPNPGDQAPSLIDSAGRQIVPAFSSS